MLKTSRALPSSSPVVRLVHTYHPVTLFVLLCLETQGTWLRINNDTSPVLVRQRQLKRRNHSHSKGRPASFRPSELRTQNTTARLKPREPLIPKRHKVFTLQPNSKEGYQQARSDSGGPVQLFSFYFLSPHLLCCHSPSTVRERLFFR